MNKIQKTALVYVAILIFTGYGYAVGRLKVFPHALLEKHVKEFEAFAAGDSKEKETSAWQKMANDWGLSRERITYAYPDAAKQGAKETPYTGLKSRENPPLVFVHPEHQEGYRIIIGAFDFEDTLWGGLLLDSAGEPLHHWGLSTEHLPGNKRVDAGKNLYPAHVFPDGSVIFSMAEAGGGIVKVDACSNVLWNLNGNFHHAISPDEHGSFWTFIGKQPNMNQNLARISVETGQIEQRIDMKDVRVANPDLFIWDLYYHTLNRERDIRFANMSHGNDVDPLPEALAEDFPQFSPGDLVISYATTNMIFVLDPRTLEVKWWRAGLGDFQHDPDWEPGGNITLFSNNMRGGDSRDTSTIVTVDPKTMEQSIAYDGDLTQMFSNINGAHELSPFDTRMITSSTQGWVLEVDSSDEIVFSFVNNTNTAEQQALHLSRSWRYAEDYFDSPFWEECAAK